jgi:hypothetical protein
MANAYNVKILGSRMIALAACEVPAVRIVSHEQDWA